ncbi:transcription elongation factor Spt5 [Candidatus Bathyarchaeota archaeon]|nr:MAG: transcription elongation factor Spt5 [Candidatus Bathyarchaeota archaeon]
MGEEVEKTEEKPVEKEEKVEEKKVEKGKVYVLKTTAGQELNVANMVYMRASSAKLPIYSILVTESLKGYVFIEAAGPHFVDEAASGIKHAKQRLSGLVKISELEKFIVTKPIIEELDIGDTVEVVGGPFKGMRAKITRIDKPKNEVTLELLEATITLPITIHADYVRIVSKKKEE